MTTFIKKTKDKCHLRKGHLKIGTGVVLLIRDKKHPVVFVYIIVYKNLCKHSAPQNKWVEKCQQTEIRDILIISKNKNKNEVILGTKKTY